MSNALDVVKDKINNVLQKYPVINDPLEKLSEKVKIERSLLVLGLVGVLVLLIFTLSNGDFLIDLIGFLYPAYASLKAIESKEKDDDTQWLTYWLVFSMFKIVENIADFLISFIPFYFFLKVAFLVWCYYPTSGTPGATVIYNVVIKPHIIPALGIDNSKKD